MFQGEQVTRQGDIDKGGDWTVRTPSRQGKNAHLTHLTSECHIFVRLTL